MINLEHDSYFITGGCGFIGSHICEEIVRQGKRCVCMDDLSTGYRENVAHLEGKKNFVFLKADIRDEKALAEGFSSGIDIVFHNAASKNSVSLKDPHGNLDVNAWGTLLMSQMCREYGVRKMVHASSGSVYGPLIRERHDEDHPLLPVSHYGVSKLAGEGYLRSFAGMNPGFRYTVLRYFHVFGSRQESGDTGGVVPIFIRRCHEGQPLTIYGSGNQTRSFTSVKDIVQANIVAANTERTDRQAYNCASGLKVTILDLARLIRIITGRENLDLEFAPWKPGDIRDFIVDNSKAKAVGMEFDTQFTGRLRETVEWYVKNL